MRTCDDKAFGLFVLPSLYYPAGPYIGALDQMMELKSLDVFHHMFWPDFLWFNTQLIYKGQSRR